MKKLLLLAGAVFVAVIVIVSVAAGSILSDEDKAERCPDVTRGLIVDQLGEPSSFSVTSSSKYSTEGTAVIRGGEYWWGCGPGISRGNRVQVDVRNESNSSVILETVKL